MAVASVDKIAILGGGVMGETLLATLLSAGCSPSDIVVAEKSSDRAEVLADEYGVTIAEARDAVDGAALVLVVVKPQDVAGLLAEIGDAVSADATVVSFAAGIQVATLEAALPSSVAVLRVMPNTPAVVGEGMFGVSPGASCSEEQVADIVDWLSVGGKVVVIDEAQQDALTAVSGSGPAYVFYLAEAMIAGGVDAGLDAETARVLTAQTLVGAAKLLAGSDVDAAELRRRVTSPNGTTAAAIATFDAHDVRSAVAAGVIAAARRSAELSAT